MSTRVVKALVPTAEAAVLLSQEFRLANVDADGSPFTVVICGTSYADAVARIRAWAANARIGPVLVTDGATAEDLLSDFAPRSRPAGSWRHATSG